MALQQFGHLHNAAWNTACQTVSRRDHYSCALSLPLPFSPSLPSISSLIPCLKLKDCSPKTKAPLNSSLFPYFLGAQNTCCKHSSIMMDTFSHLFRLMDVSYSPLYLWLFFYNKSLTFLTGSSPSLPVLSVKGVFLLSTVLICSRSGFLLQQEDFYFAFMTFSLEGAEQAILVLGQEYLY